MVCKQNNINMKYVKLLENFENEINESNTDHFVINSKTKKLLRATSNSREYWEGDKKGTIDLEISVFASSNHQEKAKNCMMH